MNLVKYRSSVSGFSAICIVLSILLVEVVTKKILFLLPIATKSHKNIFDPLITGLAKRGHEIFVISSLLSPGMPQNVEEFVPVSAEEIFLDMRNVFKARENGGLGQLFANTDFIFNACSKVFQHPKTKELLERKQNYFDLIVINAIGNNCFYGMVHVLGAPVIAVATFPPTFQMAENYGTHLPSSFIPNPFLPFSDHMTFSERMVNIISNWIGPILSKYKYISRTEAIYRKYLGEHLPSNDIIESNFSVLLTNTHFSMNYPRPLLPDIVEIGGIHCRTAKSLPNVKLPILNDLEEFIVGAPDGFIYFSFGSVIKSQQLPENYRKVFVNAFASLKQRVLWKWDSDLMEDLPENLKLIKWAPQQDILGHKNIKLFISHGGLLSSQEAVYHGVPVLNIPFFGDQDLNSNGNLQAGIALTVEIIGMTEEILKNAIKELLENPKFSNRVRELSGIFKDQMETPLDRAIYWVEYVLKYKGAPHLRSASRILSSYEYYSLDVIACLFLSLTISLCTLLYTAKFAVRKLMNSLGAFKIPLTCASS